MVNQQQLERVVPIILKNKLHKMKYKAVFLIFFISISASCQLDNVSKTFSEKHTNKNNKVYLLKGKKYETDEETFFSSEKKKIFENKTNDEN